MGGHTHPHPLASTHTNLQIHRSVLSTRCQDSDDETEKEEEEEVEKKSYVQSRQCGSATSLHLPDIPSTVAVQVQPSAVQIHRPDLQDASHDAQDPVESSLHPLNPSEMRLLSVRLSTHNNSSASTLTESPKKLNVSSPQHSPTGAIMEPVTVEGDRRGQLKFLTPEEAARPPRQTPHVPAVPGLVEYTSRTRKRWTWSGASYLRSLWGLEEPVNYAGQYTLQGSSKPVKLRSPNTLKAISSYHGHADTRDIPVWYSFGKLELAVRYCHISKMLDVKMMKVTHLPPGRECINLDFQVRVTPGKKAKWMKMTTSEINHMEDNHIASCSLKINKMLEKSLVISGYMPGVHSHAYLALGHGIIPNLGVQQLIDEWQTFTLQLRQGIQIQDHLGTALVALSCCERVHGHFTFIVDLLQLRNMKVLRLGSKAVTSFKTRVSVWVRAIVMTEGCKAKEKELHSTPLERPKDQDKHGWEAAFKSNCSTTFSIPKEKITSSCVILEVHGRARQTVTFNESLLGKVILGPEELFGGEDNGQPVLGVESVSVPGDPLDARLTHWGLTIRRMAKVEMWHRLQI